MARPLVVGNWKMNTALRDALALTSTLTSALESGVDADVVICPPFPWLVEVSRALAGHQVSLGAQNFHYAEGGAFTGEVSHHMLKGLCQYILVGAYERRILFDERDGIIRRKLESALKHGFRPVLCVGETADDLDEGTGAFVVTRQLEAVLEDGELDERVTIAYEPSWTTMGLISPPPVSYVGEMCDHIRSALGELFPPDAVAQVRVIYGGQSNVRNAAELAADTRLDGLLVGAGSVNAETFLTLVRAFAGRA